MAVGDLSKTGEERTATRGQSEGEQSSEGEPRAGITSHGPHGSEPGSVGDLDSEGWRV